MTKCFPFRYVKTWLEVTRLAVKLFIRFPLSLRDVEDLLHERGIEICHETMRFSWARFGPMFAADASTGCERDVNGDVNRAAALVDWRGILASGNQADKGDLRRVRIRLTATVGSVIEAKLLCLKAFDVHNAAQAPDCQAAESHIRITLMNRFLALGTAEIVRVTQNLTGEDHHAAGFSNATTPQLPEISELSIAIEMRQALAQGSCRLSTEGQLRELSRIRSAIFRPRMSAEKASACIQGTDLPSAATVARWLSSKVFTSE